METKSDFRFSIGLGAVYKEFACHA